jgi:3-phenylpropionate/cinnamic acid dioxygenase small subunit
MRPLRTPWRSPISKPLKWFDTVNADDYFAIQNLIFRYCLLVDSADFEGVGALFDRADLDYDMGGPPFNHDPAAIVQSLRQGVKLYEDNGSPRTRHVCTNVIIEPDGENAARAQSSVIVFQATPDLPLQPIIGGRYHDRFAKTNKVWHFTQRRFEADLMGNLSAHLNDR